MKRTKLKYAGRFIKDCTKRSVGILISHKDKEPGSEYRYLSITANYDAAMVVVTGNIIRGKGPALGTGLYYEAPDSTHLQVISSGNLIKDVINNRVAGENVSLEKGF